MTQITPATRANARRLRAEMTPQERRLWGRLREINQMLGTHFRRQAPIGRFIADFAEYGRRLVIEVDGGQHGGARDMARDAWLKGQGFVVLRFWNTEVDGNIEGVMQVVLDAVEAAGVAPHPNPPPRGGREAFVLLASVSLKGLVPPLPRVGRGWGRGVVTNETPHRKRVDVWQSDRGVLACAD